MPNDRFTALGAPAKPLWLTSLLIALLSALSGIPKEVKSVMIVITCILVIPVLFLVGSAYVFSNSEQPSSQAKPEGPAPQPQAKQSEVTSGMAVVQDLQKTD
jgi:flagellar basal body-associated protein FliL